MSVQSQSPFLALPLEVRLVIYTLHYKDTIVWVRPLDKRGVSNTTSSQAVSLMQTCRQVRREASPIFYDWTRFHVDGQTLARSWTPSHSPNSEKRFDFTLPRGLRVLEMPYDHLQQVGYDTKSPGRWDIRKPFDQLRHLKVKKEIFLSADGGFPKKSPSIEVATLKLMAEAWHGPARLTIDLSLANDRFWTNQFSLYMDDPKQISTWICGGWHLPTYYGYVCKFLKNWGLSQAQIKSVFMTCGRMGHKLTDEEFEQIRKSHKQ